MQTSLTICDKPLTLPIRTAAKYPGLLRRFQRSGLCLLFKVLYYTSSPNNIDCLYTFIICLQAMACAYLGHWYREVGKDLGKAKNCYEETLLIDAQMSNAAECLKQVNEELGLNTRAAKDKQASQFDSAPKAASAFAAQSKEAFEVLSPRGTPSLLLSNNH